MKRNVAIILVLLLCNIHLTFAQRYFRFPKGIDEKKACIPQKIYVKLRSSAVFGHKTTPQQLNKNILAQAKVKQIKQAYTTDDFKTTKPIIDKNKADQATEELFNWYELTLNPDISLESAINLLLQDENVALAEPKYIHFPLYTPNDPLANPVGSAAQYHLNRIGAYQAWDIERGNANTIIGITDNGMDLTHVDANNFVQGTRDDVADGDNNVLGGAHGRVVTLLASAKADNNIMGAGVGFNCRYLAVKVASNSNLNAYIAGYEGILYAARFPNCKVVNMSWGRLGSPSNLELDFLKSIVAVYDVVLIAAAGNDNNQNYYYPAAYGDFVLAVAGTNSSDIKSSTSSFYDRVGICAPGEGINTESATDNSLGTSFAAPIVAGAAALVRTRYPNINARQVIRRLRNTADASIYTLAGNTAFIGRLGSGRLNVFKALNDEMVTADSVFFANSTRQGYIFNGETRNMVLRFTNWGTVIPNLQINVASTSPFVNIIKGTSNTTNVATGTIANNSADAFRIALTNTTPTNLIVSFTFTFTAGANSWVENLNVLLNPAHVNINKVHFVLNDDGALAIRNTNFYDLTGLSAVNNVSGINTRVSMLEDAGFLIGRSATQVSNAVRNTPPNRDNNFTNTVPFRQIVNTANDYAYTNTVFTDIPNNPNRMNVQITQRSYAWNVAQRDKFIILEYRVRNIGSVPLDNLFAGLYADWNVIFPANNRANWDRSNKLGYVHDVNNLFYGGIALLTDNFQNYTAYNNNTAPLSNGFSTAEKFAALSGTPTDTTIGLTILNGLDVSHLLSAKIPLLDVGAEQFITFAVIIADDLTELTNNAIVAKNVYRQIQTSPTPILNNTAVCAGSPHTIIPQGGNRFTFYTQPPPAFPIFTGNSLLINNVRTPQTYFVTCVDSLFESNASTIVISPITHTTQFTISPNDSLDLRLAGVQPITFASTTQQAISWQWNFGNGQTANIANPAPINYVNEGVYPVKLVTRNNQNCKDSLTRNIVVFRSLITNLEPFEVGISLYPNPITDYLYVDVLDNTKILSIELNDIVGRKVLQPLVASQQEIKYILDVQYLPKGVFLLKVETNKGVFLKKIIK